MRRGGKESTPRFDQHNSRCDEYLPAQPGAPPVKSKGLSIRTGIALSMVRPAPAEELLILSGALHTVRNMGSITSRWLNGDKRSGG